jgi:hypothetical protein
MTTRSLSLHLLGIAAPLMVGVAVYRTARSGTTLFESWLFSDSVEKTPRVYAHWLPDYLWCLSLLFLVALIWQGARHVPRTWWVVLWAGITGTELLQYGHIIFGTADWGDVLAYQLAFLTFLIINQKL